VNFEELVGLSDREINAFIGHLVGEQNLLGIQSQLKYELARGIRFTFPTHEDYPIQFLKMSDAPYFLRFLGSPIWNNRKGLAIVGARDIVPLSTKWLEINLTDWIKENSVFIVSGGARGVDQLAHQICMRNGQPTVIFIPAGLGNIYPSSLNSWIPKVVELGGAIVSEYAHDEPMKKYYFQARNRLIAAMGLGTLIVQASRKSGTIITANRANLSGRPVWVIPGHPLDFQFAGNNDLIFEGATPIRDHLDLGHIFSAELPMW
jgi:DNA processing protein